MPKLSVIIPVYYNEESLRPLYADLKKKVIDVTDAEVEVVFVDDGSEDGSYQVLVEIEKEHPGVRVIRLSRNFGSHAAILCGLSHASGDCAVVKAADLQEPSEIILEMYESWKAGNNVVLAVRKGRKESVEQRFFAAVYYWLVRKIALPQMPKHGFDVYLIDRKVIEVLDRMDEKNSALTGQILWSGFKTEKVYYTRLERQTGRSRWTLRKKIKLFTDTFFSFTTIPISFVTGIGALSFAGSLLWALITAILKLAGRIPSVGWTSLFIFCLFSFGVIMLSIGLLGAYLWRAFDAVRNRPLYIVEEDSGEENERWKCEQEI